MLEQILQDASRAHGLDIDLLRALAAQESSWNPWAVRYEPQWRYFSAPAEWASRLGITEATERVLQSCSWGPMQIMGSVAREMGFEGEIPRLTDAQTGVRYSCLKLKTLHQKYDYEPDVISAWNHGNATKTPGGMYFNQRYVDEVSARLRALRKIS